MRISNQRSKTSWMESLRHPALVTLRQRHWVTALISALTLWIVTHRQEETQELGEMLVQESAGCTSRLTNKAEWKASHTWEGPDVWKTKPQTKVPPGKDPAKSQTAKGPRPACQMAQPFIRSIYNKLTNAT